MQAPASNYPVAAETGPRSSGWGGPSDAPTQITQGRSSLAVTLLRPFFHRPATSSAGNFFR